MLTEFVVDNAYTVRLFPKINYFGGTTSVSSVDGGVPFTTDVTYYNLNLDQKNMTCELFSLQARLNPKMPWMNLVFTEIPFTLTDDGVTFEKDKLIPYSVTFNSVTGEEEPNNRKPYPNFELIDLSGSMSVATSLKFSYSRDGVGTTVFNGTPLVKVNPAN